MKRFAYAFGARGVATILVMLAGLSARSAEAQNTNQVEQSPLGNPIDYSTARFSKVAHALAITESITIDGRLDEPAWQRAQPATGFIQWDPKPGAPASGETEVRFLYDARNLYVGARLHDPDPTRIVVHELKEDFNITDTDLFGFTVDSLHDHQTGFWFGTNPAGARHDAQIARDGDIQNIDWDGAWNVKVTTDADGWVAEFVVPFKTLRFTSAPSQEWGLNMWRKIRRFNEDSYWSPLPRRYRVNRMSMAGTLTNLTDLRPGRNFKIKPFVIGSALHAATGDRSKTNVDGNGGIDLKYGLTQSVTLDLTYRTDFAQVEVDQQQINLTRFNLFFPEKREFFLENAGIFDVAGASGTNANVIPFFSRRIGLTASGIPVPLVGGARASGRVGSYDVGVIAMRAERQDGAPPNNFTVARLRKNLRGNSTFGAIMTTRDSVVGADQNRLYGVDTRLRFFEKLDVSSYVFRSETPGRRGRDQARLLAAQWRDNDVTLGAEYEEVQPNFNPEVGFVRRNDMTRYSGDMSWRPRPARNVVIRNYNLAVGIDYYTDVSGRPETRLQKFDVGASFQNSSQLGLTVANTFDRLARPFAIRPSLAIPPGDYEYLNYSVNYNSDRSRMLSGSINSTFGEFWDGENRSVGGGFALKANYHFNIEGTFSRNSISLPGGDFVTNLIGARLFYGFTTTAFINSFLQYNSATRQVSANTRFNLIHRPLSDLYVVYNERRDTWRGALVDRGLIVKFTDMFDF